MRKLFAAIVLSLIASAAAAAPQFPFSPPGSGNRAALSRAMAQLANGVLGVYRDKDRGTFLDNRFRLEMVAGRYADAAKTVAALRAMPSGEDDPPQARARDAQYEILARAEALHGRAHVPLAKAFATAFRALVRPLDDKTSALVMRLFDGEKYGGLSLLIDQTALARQLEGDLARRKGKTAIALPEALALIRAYQVDESYRTFMPFAAALVREDDNRRYIVRTNIRVPIPGGAILCAQSIRPRTSRRLPTLLEFTVYADPSSTLAEARRSASHGYVGVTGFSRGKMCSPDAPVPFEHDGAGAAALIGWIAKQPWSDGRVGMFGGSYDGFTQWATAKYAPKALKAIMPSAATAPGIDNPMEGNVGLGFNFYRPLYVASGHGLDGAAFEDHARWNRLFRDWYVSGRAWRDLSAIAHVSNPVWDRWFSHPDYDAYWRAMIPYKSQFARIRIPVLATTGYYDGASLGALYYFSQHRAWLPDAEQYLAIGPYSHVSGQRGAVDVLGDPQKTLDGYTLDPAAMIDMGVLRYRWFDYIFRGAPKPAILRNRVNYEVMGANVWRHAPSLAAMANTTLRFYLSPATAGYAHLLARTAPDTAATIAQTVDFADRSDADRVAPGGGVLDRALDTWLALEFVSAPFTKPVEVSGLFSGTLRFVTNKKDFDFAIELYELTPDHKYFSLSYVLARASYVADRSHRHLLEPGVPQQLSFRSGRLTARKFARGSRLVVLVSLVRQPGTEINYGTGGVVARETIADAKIPLRIEWSNRSDIDIPVRE